MAIFSLHPLITIAASGIAVAAILFVLVVDLRRRWDMAFGRRAKTNAELIEDVFRRLIQNETALAQIQPRLEALESSALDSFQKFGFKRFNPFGDTGGDQSFALTLLDQKNDGVVISSLYSREGVRVYAKEIRSGSSKYALSSEEQEVLAEAMTKTIAR